MGKIIIVRRIECRTRGVRRPQHAVSATREKIIRTAKEDKMLLMEAIDMVFVECIHSTCASLRNDAQFREEFGGSVV